LGVVPLAVLRLPTVPARAPPYYQPPMAPEQELRWLEEYKKELEECVKELEEEKKSIEEEIKGVEARIEELKKRMLQR